MSGSSVKGRGWPCTCPLVREGRLTAHKPAHLCSRVPVLSGTWEWHVPGLEKPLAYYGTSWPLPVPPYAQMPLSGHPSFPSC